MVKQKGKCQVCFFSTPSSLKCLQLISCKGCKKVAHRYCYAPECDDKQFQCDACLNKAKNPQCSICHNHGLLKRTEEGEYAHPACLMVCKEALVKSYKDLSFNILRSKRKSKTAKCNICSKASFVSDLLECFDKSCAKTAHYYCILKQQWKDDKEEDNKWVQELKIFKNDNFNYLEYFENKVKKYIKLFSGTAYKVIFGNAQITDEIPNYITYCRDHCTNLNNCNCDDLEDERTKIDWIFCDNCSKWYHFSCEQLQEESLEENYTCKSCKAWEGKYEKNEEPLVNNFPRLHFYDFVRIQLYAESKNYRLSSGMRNLIKRVPFTCSLKNFTENLKTRDMISKILKATNMLSIKKFLTSKVIKKSLEKPGKELLDVIWKLDFIINSDPITAVFGLKACKLKLEEILLILQKFEKKRGQGSNIIQAAIKQLQRYRSSIKKEQDQESQEENEKQYIREEIGQLTVMLKFFTNQLKQCKGATETYNTITKFYQKINSNQFLKQLLKDYIDEKNPSFYLYKPVFIYDSQQDMTMHTRINMLYKQLVKDMHGQMKRSQLVIEARHIMHLYRGSSKKVQKQNTDVVMEIESLDYQKQNESTFPNQRNLFVPKPSSMGSIQAILTNNKRKESNMMEHTQACITSLLQQKHIMNMLKTFQLKQNSLNLLYQNFKKIKQHIQERNNARIESLLEAYLKLSNSSKKLVTGIYECETGFSQEQKLDIDMLIIIKTTKIDLGNIYRFCTFFTQTCKLELYGLNQAFEKTLYTKGQQFLDLIAARSMIFQCQIEFKTAVALIAKYSYNQPKIIELIKLNKQLEEMLSEINLNSLQDMSFFDSHMKKLQEAKEFCQENGLQFRISKIEHMMKLYQLKEEAFNYFPIDFVIKNKFCLPKKYLAIEPRTSIDMYILKKFLYKMKILKFPQTDHLFIKVHQLFTQQGQYFNTLASFIIQYNALLNNQPVIELDKKFTKKQILDFIESKKNKFVTCEPQEDEIKIICDLYTQLLDKIESKMKENVMDSEEMDELEKKLMKFPLQPDNNEQAMLIYEFLRSRQKKQIILEPQIVENIAFYRKNELDETSARMQSNSRSLQNGGQVFKRSRVLFRK